METIRPSISASDSTNSRAFFGDIIYDYLRPAWGEYGGLS